MSERERKLNIYFYTLSCSNSHHITWMGKGSDEVYVYELEGCENIQLLFALGSCFGDAFDFGSVCVDCRLYITKASHTQQTYVANYDSMY